LLLLLRSTRETRLLHHGADQLGGGLRLGARSIGTKWIRLIAIVLQVPLLQLLHLFMNGSNLSGDGGESLVLILNGLLDHCRRE
jgi:hypothetical protein